MRHTYICMRQSLGTTGMAPLSPGLDALSFPILVRHMRILFFFGCIELFMQPSSLSSPALPAAVHIFTILYHGSGLFATMLFVTLMFSHTSFMLRMNDALASATTKRPVACEDNILDLGGGVPCEQSAPRLIVGLHVDNARVIEDRVVPKDHVINHLTACQCWL